MLEARDIVVGSTIWQNKIFETINLQNVVVSNGKEVAVTTENIFHILNSLEDFEGIPLTEEWLIRFGFEKTSYFKDWGMRYFKKGICIYLEDGEFRFYYQTNRAFTSYDSVHEIQNLYFSLTGEELTTN